MKRDIGDDEIRLISFEKSSSGKEGATTFSRARGRVSAHVCVASGRQRSNGPVRWAWVQKSLVPAVAVLLIMGVIYGVCLLYMKSGIRKTDEGEVAQTARNVLAESTGASAVPFAGMADTVVEGRRFTIITPRNAVPVLHIGKDILEDTLAVLVAQAADVRKDNGEIAGAFVLKGELKGRGQAKSGFCAIVNESITIGVSDATPMLEKTLETDGYFFRQYPLVVAGQLVENKPKGRALRRALAEMNGGFSVVVSHERLTLHEFSQALVNLGVQNAISLVGASAYGFAKDAEGGRFEFGKPGSECGRNTNYIVWK